MFKYKLVCKLCLQVQKLEKQMIQRLSRSERIGPIGPQPRYQGKRRGLRLDIPWGLVAGVAAVAVGAIVWNMLGDDSEDTLRYHDLKDSYIGSLGTSGWYNSSKWRIVHFNYLDKIGQRDLF